MENAVRAGRRVWRVALGAGAAAIGIALATNTPVLRAQPDDSLPTIRRTEYGVPHILASNFRGVGIGLGYTQVEDYSDRVILSALRGKGWMGRTFGRDSMNGDFAAQVDLMRVQETFPLLDAETRAVYEGFAEGINIFIRAHPDRVPAWAKPIFTGYDIAAMDIGDAGITAATRLVQRQLSRDSVRAAGVPKDDAESPAYSDDGSNAWAFAPSRSKTGNAMLLRNPHLAWTAGYWEAHVTVPGQLDFYGDFRIGSPFAVVAGFNRNLGWATTNNAADLDEVYALDIDQSAPDHYLFDGVSIAIRSVNNTVSYRTPAGLQQETRVFLTTPIGPVVHRTNNKLYVVRAGPDGEYRAGEQFLRMMRAKNLVEWKAALAMRARATSNLTYADRAGNIFLIWMASIPRRTGASGGDSVALPVHASGEIWTSLVGLDSLPQVLNPRGGYVQNSNDAPYYTNLHAILDTLKFPAYFERPDFGLRTQLAVQLIDNTRKLSLEDVMRLKHNLRMLLADRVKIELIKAVRALSTDTALLHAATTLEHWDNTVSIDSRGSTLFEAWFRRYTAQARDSTYAEPWTPAKLATTPRGIGQPALAVTAFAWAVDDIRRRYGASDVTWGEVHRVRRGNVDVPVGGCTGLLGCFRVLSYGTATDGKQVANTGDGWVLGVEFAKTGPRALSILAYGQSPDSASPHHADQAAMFAKGQMKTVRFTEADISKHTERTYKPGQK
ncbi:MAG: penicillin acylase family protein [Gemmatimonadaceae bacterium]